MVSHSACALLLLATSSVTQTDYAVPESQDMTAANPFGLGVPHEVATGLRITPIAVIEDSRCPSGVICIQAGRLVIEALVEHSGVEQVRTVELGGTMLVPGGTVAFADAGERGPAGEGEPDYRFAFTYVPNIMF